MGDNISAARVELSGIDLSWMLGRATSSFSFLEPDLWIIAFSGGGSVSTQSIWRLLTASAMAVCSEDHGQQFGLPTPVDAAALATADVSGAAIVEASIRASAPDLILRFDNGLVLQVLATSVGYESWQVTAPTGESVVVDGGRNASAWTQAPNRST